MVSAVATIRDRGLKGYGRRLAALRDMAGWTQRRAAELARVTERQYSRWEHDEQNIPGATWELLCLKAGVDFEWAPSVTLTPKQ
jgi:transcriptional regulator with XRE-family HTH domain